MGEVQVGWMEARAFAGSLCKWASHMLSRVWGTAPLCEVNEEGGEALCMRCVAIGWGDGVEGAGERVQERLYHEHRIECPIKTIEGRLYARISAHIYNRPEDYIHLAYAVLAMKQGSIDTSH